MTYNLTAVGNQTTNMLTFFQLVNENIMRDQMGNFMIIAVGLILLITFIQTSQDTKKSLAASSFICFLLSLTLFAVDLVHSWTVVVCLILAGVCAAFIIKS